MSDEPFNFESPKTAEDCVKELQYLFATPYDPETDHITADATLCRALEILGHKEIADAFRKASEGFWYA